MRININVSPGELADKLTVLIVKLDNITDEDKLFHVRNEYATLIESYDNIHKSINIEQSQTLEHCVKELTRINRELWDILQTQRDLENSHDLGHRFVQVSLKVYYINDERAAYKRKINEMLGTDIAEVKMYK